MVGRLVGRRNEIERSSAGVSRRGGALLRGVSGVGKTVLLDSLVDRCRRSGWTIAALHTASATRALPLWPFFHLLPEAAATDRSQLAEQVRGRLVGDDGERLLLVVDDAQDLDEDSVALLHDLLRADDCSVLATLRLGEEVPDGLDELWTMADVEEVDVPPFDPGDVARLVETLLTGPVDDTIVDTVVRGSRGNALLVRELLLDAVDTGHVAREGGTWRMVGDAEQLLAQLAGRTVRCVERRIGRLDDDAHRTLRLIAVAGGLRESQLPVELAPTIDELTGRHLLSRTVDDGDAIVDVDHPVVAEVVVRGLNETGRWSVQRELIELVHSGSERRRGDAVRVATWAVETGTSIAVDDWVAAAREAIGAFDVERGTVWARAAVATDDRSHAAHRALGEVLRLAGDLRDAADAFRTAASWAVEDNDIAATAVDRAALTGFQLGDPEEAIAILVAAADVVDDPILAAALRSEAGILGTLLGRFEDVLLARPTEAELAATDPATRWLIGVNEVYARTMLGRLGDIDALVGRVREDFESVAGERPHELDLLLGLHAAARLQRGELLLGITELEPIVDDRRQRGEYRGIAAAVLALLMDLTGHPRAAELAADGVEQHEWMDPFGSAPIAVAAAALVSCAAGDGADGLGLDDAHERLAGSEPWTSIWVGRARARAAWEAGDDASAVEQALAAGIVAVETNHFGYASVTLHDVVRYGAADRVLPTLHDAVAKTDGCELLEVLLEHADSVVDGDPDALEHCAGAFLRMGAWSLAADALRQRAGTQVVAGDAVAGRCSALRAGAVIAGTGLRHRPCAVDIPDEPSAREIEIAVFASSGRSSREIADDAFISVRTVDNHLRSVYRKLDVDGREELADMLAPLLDQLP